jgi:hypothetical protein
MIQYPTYPLLPWLVHLFSPLSRHVNSKPAGEVRPQKQGNETECITYIFIL